MAKCLISAWTEKDGNDLTDDKLIRINPAKPEFGSLMLVSPTVVIAPGGFLNKRNITGFIAGNVEDLKAVVSEYKLKAGMDYSKVFGEHKIITVEKLESECRADGKDGFRPKMNPTTEEELTCEGELIKRRTYIVQDSLEAVDVLIDHDREDEGVVVDPAQEEFAGAAKSGSK